MPDTKWEDSITYSNSEMVYKSVICNVSCKCRVDCREKCYIFFLVNFYIIHNLVQKLKNHGTTKFR